MINVSFSHKSLSNLVAFLFQIATLVSLVGSSISQQINTFTQPKCCSDPVLPWLFKPQPWEDILRQATYQSIIRHLDFTGTLDGRLDRDQKLWKQFMEADFMEEKDKLVNNAQDTETGILKILYESEHKISFKYYKTDKSVYECSRRECDAEDKSLLALWQVRKAEHPYTLRINVKLPRINSSPLEDVYDYNGKYGLKKINPDQLEYSELKNLKSHRFSFPQDKKNIERADFRFENSNGGFNVGINSPPFLYNPSVVVPSKAENGWVIPPPRKTRPGVVVDTGLRHPKLFDTPTGPYIASEGPNGFHHIIHSLPSISPPQSFDSIQQLRGFLPSIGPVRAPSPYKTEYAYDPRYVMYYNRQLSVDTTPATRQFKPSTEYVRYSEVDPFYHTNTDSDLHTTPMPIDHVQKFTSSTPFINNLFYKVKPSFPTSINEQLPTKLPSTTSSTKPSFQIIVGDMNSDIKPTTGISTPINKESTKTQMPRTKPTPKSRLQIRDKPKPVENKNTTKYFGDKIKTKGQRNGNVSTFKPIIVKSMPQTMENYKKETNQNRGEIKNTTTTNYDDNSFTRFTNKKVSTRPQRIKNTTFKDILERNKIKSKLRKNIQEYTTTISNAKETTNTDLDYETTTEYNEQEHFTNIDWEMKTEGKKNTFHSDFSPTLNSEIVSDETKTDNSTTNRNASIEVDNDSTLYDYYYNEETTEPSNETTSTDSNVSDFFTSLTDNNLTMETSTDVTSTSTESPHSPSIDGDTQESNVHNTQYRLLTFPGDSVSIVANRISKTYSYRTAGGKEGKLQTKEHNDKISDVYKGLRTVL